MAHCIIETNLATSQYSYPFQRGWLETPEWLILRDRVTLEQIEDGDACALINAIDATRVLDSFSVVSDVALVSTHRGTVNMRTTQRPDEVENTVVQLGEVSATAEALARATIYHFYGIDVLDWNRSSQDADVSVVEGPETLRAAGDTYNEDLIRAWFILTSLSMPTHLLIAPRELLDNDMSGIKEMVSLLRHAAEVSSERRRELRRNLSADLELDRELVTEYFNDQKTRLTRSARKGWLDLTNRVARAMDLPVGPDPDVVTFNLAGED